MPKYFGIEAFHHNSGMIEQSQSVSSFICTDLIKGSFCTYRLGSLQCQDCVCFDLLRSIHLKTVGLFLNLQTLNKKFNLQDVTFTISFEGSHKNSKQNAHPVKSCTTLECVCHHDDDARSMHNKDNLAP